MNQIQGYDDFSRNLMQKYTRNISTNTHFFLSFAQNGLYLNETITQNFGTSDKVRNDRIKYKYENL